MTRADEDTLVRVKGVTKTYTRVVALNAITLDIHQGERVALVGPSGSGKSTLLNLLSGTMQPDEGSISVGGREFTRNLPRRELASLVGIIHQQFDLVPQLPVVHNVLAGRFGRWGMFRSLLSLAWPQDYRLALDALQQMGISDKVQERTSHLSGGEQQRVAIARTIVQSPRLVLADEPVASLDPVRAEEVMQLLAGLAGASGRALVASIHTTDLVRRHFTRVVGLRDGLLQFDMSSADITQKLLSDLYELAHDESNLFWR